MAIPPSLLNTSGFDASNDAPDIYIFLPAAAATAADTRQNTAINSQDSHVAAAAAAAAKAAEYGYAGLRSEYLKLTGAVPALPDEAFGTWFSWCECDRRAFITISPLTIASSSCFCLWMCSDSLVLSLVALARCWHIEMVAVVVLAVPLVLVLARCWHIDMHADHPYNQSAAEADIARWRSDDLPLDIWGLDMDWR